ncbi:MAG: hypothetical protein KDI79_06735 [Anaerolineae bacterium]|nr:hypothetical protein [Anaerolineae bacterium]
MLQKTHNRVIFGGLIGAFGGSSFVLSVYPIAIGLLFEQLSGNALLLTLVYVIPVAVLWGIGGAVSGWLGKMREGAAIMALCGLISGILISANLLGESGGSTILLAGGLIGLIYGIPAGLLISGALRRPEA